MKIKFKKLEATNTLVKLFGLNRNKETGNAPENEESGDAYEYYYKRGDTYYFRNSEGDKFSIAYKEPQTELVKGNKYTMEVINNLGS
jgi:hypothetical protein